MKGNELDFEIEFFEAILKENPKFVSALFALGDAYTKKGLYEEGLKVDKQLLKLRPLDPVVHYNLACDYSLLNKIELSLFHLEKSIKFGWRDFKFMGKDPDLKNLRQDKRYKELILKYKKKPIKI